MAAGTPEQIDLNPVGTGPFQVVQYQKDAVIRYKAFPEYWEGKAPIDNLIFAITPDSTVRYQKLKAGECHVMPYPNPADLAAMEADGDINLMSQEGLNVGYLGYNTQKEPFTNVKVRKALNMAINKAAIIEGVYQGAGVAAKNPIPPTIWSYNNDTVDDPYDPEAAKKLLAEAGYPDGFTTDIWAMPVQRPYNPNARRMAELVQADWAAIGVNAEIVSYEWGEYLDRTKKGEQGSFMLGWTGDNGDPDNFLAVLLGCDAVGSANRAQWCNEEFDSLIQQAKTTADVLERTRLYEEAQAVFKREAPWATIAHSIVFEPIRNEVVDYKIDPFGGHIFYGVDIKE
jgi:dipeptide transport system substrate-binding protein